jgi:hypothetical protein
MALRLPAKRHKFNAKVTVVDGLKFASKKEAKRYGELKLLEKAGHIYALELQPAFTLHVLGRKIGTYRADFAYCRKDLRGAVRVIEDVKGLKTPMYRWKAKHLKAEYGIEIREI